jgi:ribonuclease HI
MNPDGRVLKEISRSLGTRTNNQAEYEALLAALRETGCLSPAPVTIRTDSELLFYQVRGRYRVRSSGLRPLHTEAAALLAAQPGTKLELVRREANRETDRLAKAGADSTGG